MKTVWDEAVVQSHQVTAYWYARGNSAQAGFNTTVADLNTLTLNVFIKAAMGRSWDFCGADDHEGRASIEGKYGQVQGEMSYRDSLFFVTHNIVSYVMMPAWLWSAPSWILPSFVRRYITAYNTFGNYMEQAVRTAKEQLANGNMAENPSVIDYLVNKSEEVRREEVKSSKEEDRERGLSDTDIYGTLFTLNQTGHETSTSVLSSTIYLLAAFPEWQEWARRDFESFQYPGDLGSNDIPSYEEVYPKLKRCVALMVCHILAQSSHLSPSTHMAEFTC